MGHGPHTQVWSSIPSYFYPLTLIPPRFRKFLAKELRARLIARGKLVKEKQKASPTLNPHVPERWWRTPISSLLHRTNTPHDGRDDETDSDPSTQKKDQNRRLQPHMIRRTDEKPRPINPSGWISQGRMPTAQPGLMESTRSKASTQEHQPTGPSLSQPPEPAHSQLFDQQPNEPDAESGSELEDLSEIPRRGRHSRRVSDPGTFPHRKFVLG